MTQKHHQNQSPLIGMLCMIGAGLSFGTMVAFVKAAAHTIPVVEIICVRSLITAIVVTTLMVRYRIPFIGKNRRILFLRALLGTVAIGLSFYAASVIPLVDLSVIIKTSVIFTAIFASIWLKEHPPRGLYMYTLLGLLGIALVLKPTGNVLAFGGIAALIAAMMIGLVGATVRRLQQTEHSYTIIFTYMWMATLSYGILFGYSFISPTTTEACYMIAAGTIGTLGQFLFTAAYKYGPAGEVSPFLYSEVLFAALLGAVYFHEIPDTLTVVGTLLTVYAGIAIARASAKQRKRSYSEKENTPSCTIDESGLR